MSHIAAHTYRADIDGLRAIAIASVVAFHAGIPGIQSGFVGVDIFFVISGYLITGILLNEVSATGRIALGQFIARRIRRLLPVFACVLIVTMVLAAATMFPNELPRMGKSAIAAATISGNLHFLTYSGGYFDPATDVMPLLHTWSLAVEEQYYLIWPLALWGIWAIASRLGKPQTNWIAGLLLLTVLVSFAANVLFIDQRHALVFYMMPFRAWEFALGGLLISWKPSLEKLSTGLSETLFLVGLALVVYAVIGLDAQATYPGWLALYPVVGTLFMITSGCNRRAQLPRYLLGNRLFVRVGLLSYSWYLWHWPLLALARAHDLGVRSLPRDIAISALALLLSWATYHLIESPIRYKPPTGFKTNRSTLFSGLAISVLLIALASGVIEYGRRQSALLNETVLSNNESTDNSAEKRCENTHSTQDCSVGPPNTALGVVAWGDSHISHWRPLFEKETHQLNTKILLRVELTCPPLLDAVPYKQRRGNVACGKQNDQVIEEIRNQAKLGSLQGVVISARWNEYLARQETDPGAMSAWALADHWKTLGPSGEGMAQVGVAPYDHPGSVRTFEASLTRTIDALTQLGLRVLVIAPVPELYFSGPQCLYLRSDEKCVVPRSKVEDRRLATMNVLTTVSQGRSNVRVFDPINEFCDANTCFAKRSGVSQYTDHNHVSHKKALDTMPVLEPFMKWVSGVR